MWQRRLMVAVGLAIVMVATSLALPSVAASSTISAEDRARFALEDVTIPEPLPKDEFEHLLQLRRSSGFSARRDFVRKLYAHPTSLGAVRSTSSALFLGFLLAPDEVAWAKKRGELEWQQVFVRVKRGQ